VPQWAFATHPFVTPRATQRYEPVATSPQIRTPTSDLAAPLRQGLSATRVFGPHITKRTQMTGHSIALNHNVFGARDTAPQAQKPRQLNRTIDRDRGCTPITIAGWPFKIVSIVDEHHP
jgi:hypothetical protein